MPHSLLDSRVEELARYQDALDEALDSGPEAYAGLFDSPPAGLSVHEIDLDRVIRRVSPAHQSLLGYPPARMLGQRAAEFIVLHETAERAMHQKLSGARPLQPFVRAFRRADHKPITLLLLDRHLLDGEGTVAGIRTVLTEIPPEIVLGL